MGTGGGARIAAGPAPRVSIVLPCHNEEHALGSLLAELSAAPAVRGGALEVVAVNDGSRDGTAGILAGRARTCPWLRVVTHPVNRGYGGALASGFAAATGEIVVYMDADGQFRVQDLLAVAGEGSAHTLVACYRRRRQDPIVRRLLGKTWTLLCSLLLRFRVRDLDCGMKAFPMWLVRDPPLTAAGAVISAELLYRARRMGLRVVNRGVDHLPRAAGRASGASVRVIARAVCELAALRLRTLVGSYGLPRRKPTRTP